MHKHHITPKHRDPKSAKTVTVSPTCHAMFHWCEWKLWNNWQDEVAWRGLAGLATTQESSLKAQSMGGKKGGAISKPTNIRHDLKAQAKTIAQEYLSGVLTPELRKKYRCGQGTILKILKEAGVKLNKRGLKTPEQKLAHLNLLKTRAICPYCGAHGQYVGMKTYHFDNCKHKP